MDPIPLETVKVIMKKENRRVTLPWRIALWGGGLLTLLIMLIQ